jgi:hypothetical protein
MHKHKFSQVYCIEILKRILKKFSLYFLKVSRNFYAFLKFTRIFGIY